MPRPGTRHFIGPLTKTQQRRRKRARENFRDAQEIADARNIPMSESFKVLHEYQKCGPTVAYSYGTGEYP